MKHLPKYTHGVLRAVAALLCLAAAGPLEAKVARPVVTCRVEVDRAVLPADTAQDAVIKITLDAATPPVREARPPVNLCIVLDRSGSMQGRKLEQAKDAAIEALRRLNGADMFSLVMYDHTVETVVPAQSAANSEWIEARIRQIRAGGNTALFGGVSQGAAEIRKHQEGRYVHRIILLSDGLANVGPSTAVDLGRLGGGLVKEGISVSTIGVGTDYNEDLMARLAERSDGNTYFVEDSRDLARIFNAELGDVLSVVAKKVNVVIECPEGIRPVNVIGREARIRGRTVELYLNQLYGGQAKYALVEVHVPAARAGASRELAVARISYDDQVTQRRETVEGRAVGRFSEDRRDVEQFTNTDVQKAVEINLNAIAQEQAIEQADRGEAGEAARTLKSSALNLRQLGAKLKDAVLMRKAEEMEQRAEELEEDGLTPGGRKAMRAGAYQDRNQQLAQ